MKERKVTDYPRRNYLLAFEQAKFPGKKSQLESFELTTSFLKSYYQLNEQTDGRADDRRVTLPNPMRAKTTAFTLSIHALL